MRAARWGLLLCAVTACSRTRSEAPVAVDATPATSAPTARAAPAAAAAVVDAGAAPLVNLLLETEAKVKVSSRVDNPKDFPEHLVDGKRETAWNSRTGDLNGWIEIELPAGTTVKTIALTVGFDKKKGAEDLFLMNHRIKRVRISRDGKPVKEVTLDPSKRELQRIPVDLDGGKLRIDVLETEPGTRKDWKELVVSDIEVLGHTKKRLAVPRLPVVDVAPGSAPPPRPPKSFDALEAVGRSAPSLKGLCDTWWADVSAALAAEKKTPEPGGPWCSLSTQSTPRNGDPRFSQVRVAPFDGPLPAPWKAVHAIGFERYRGSWADSERHLVFERNDGSVVVGPSFDYDSDFSCPGSIRPVQTRFRFVTARGKTVLVGARTTSGGYWNESLGFPIEDCASEVYYEALACLFDGPNPVCTATFVPMGKPQERVPCADIDARSVAWPSLDDAGQIVTAPP